ncbi:MAG: hypothetical protein PUG68_07210 [Lachnospiraceae bacterium]|nr:hypothetical protein [Lachnospiraceae bacterium]MDY2759098.1 hypothetical protein [Lachnospiraceae bacterium]
MVKIAVCDDDRYARKDIKDHLLEYSMSNEFEYTVDEYDSGEGLNLLYFLCRREE